MIFDFSRLRTRSTSDRISAGALASL